MNFLEAIEPFNDRLDTYQKLKTFSGIQPRDLRLLADIFLEYVANPKGDMIPTLGCSPCVAKMFQRLVTHREQERQNNVDFFNSISKDNTITISIGEVEFIQRDLEDQIAEETGQGFKDHPELSEEAKEAYEDDIIKSLAWGAFKKHCNEQGLNVKGKTKKQLLNELGL